MEHMDQLKKIRSDAIARIRTSPDFKLAGKLGLLIVELGDTVDDNVDFDEPEDTAASSSKTSPLGSLATPLAAGSTIPRTFETAFSKTKMDEVEELTSNEMIEELVAEIEGDAAELDAIMAEQTSDDDTATVGPFLKPDTTKSSYANGSTH